MRFDVLVEERARPKRVVLTWQGVRLHGDDLKQETRGVLTSKISGPLDVNDVVNALLDWAQLYVAKYLGEGDAVNIYLTDRDLLEDIREQVNELPAAYVRQNYPRNPMWLLRKALADQNRRFIKMDSKTKTHKALRAIFAGIEKDLS